MHFEEALVIGFVGTGIGVIAAIFARRRFPGCLASILFGVAGALIGQMLASRLELPVLLRVESAAGTSLSILWMTLGSVLFVAMLAAATGRRADGWRYGPRR